MFGTAKEWVERVLEVEVFTLCPDLPKILNSIHSLPPDRVETFTFLSFIFLSDSSSRFPPIPQNVADFRSSVPETLTFPPLVNITLQVWRPELLIIILYLGPINEDVENHRPSFLLQKIFFQRSAQDRVRLLGGLSH